MYCCDLDFQIWQLPIVFNMCYFHTEICNILLMMYTAGKFTVQKIYRKGKNVNVVPLYLIVGDGTSREHQVMVS